MLDLTLLVNDLTLARRHLSIALVNMAETELNNAHCEALLVCLTGIEQMQAWIRLFLERSRPSGDGSNASRAMSTADFEAWMRRAGGTSWLAN
jgi:hypothetical protein